MEAWKLILYKKSKPKTDEEKYKYYKSRYGSAQLTNFGEHTWQQVEEKFVKDAKTGKILVRTREVKYLGRSEQGFNFYLGPKSRLLESDKAIPSFYQ